MPNSEPLMLALNPWLLLGLLLLTMLLAYVARRPVHALLTTAVRAVRLGARLLTVYCLRASLVVRGWCERLLLRQARDATAFELRYAHESLAERVRTELASLPVLKQRLGGHIAAMEEDFQRSTDTPAEPPNWGQVMDAVSRLGNEHSGAVARTLEDIRDTLAQQRADARDQQRQQHQRRYLLLYRMMPRWRRVQRVLEAVDARLGRLEQSMRLTRRSLVNYQRLRPAARQELVVLGASALGRFLLSALLLAAAVAGVTVYAALAAAPIRSVMGEAPVLAELATWQLALGLLIGLQVLLGMLMLDSQRVSRVIYPLGILPTTARRAIFWLSFGTMLLLAAGIAWAYYWLALQTVAVAPLAVDTVGEQVLLGVVGEAVLGAILLLFPFLLAFAAVPLGMLGATLRPVLAMGLWGLLQLGAALGRLLGIVATVSGRVALRLYDVFIALPLWIERLVRARYGQRTQDNKGAESQSRPQSVPALAAIELSGRPAHNKE